MSQMTSTQREAYLTLLEEKHQIGDLKAALARAENRVAGELQDYDARCASKKRNILQEMADSLSQIF